MTSRRGSFVAPRFPALMLQSLRRHRPGWSPPVSLRRLTPPSALTTVRPMKKGKVPAETLACLAFVMKGEPGN